MMERQSYLWRCRCQQKTQAQGVFATFDVPHYRDLYSTRKTVGRQQIQVYRYEYY